MNQQVSSTPQTVEILGACLHPLTLAEWNGIVAKSIQSGCGTTVFSVNLHALYLMIRDEGLQAAHVIADYTRIDGMAVIGLARLLGFRLRRSHRLTWLDWIDPLLTLAEQSGWSVFYLGSAPEIVSRGETRLRESYPSLRLASHHGYFDADVTGIENRQVLDEIRLFNPDILIVGMGMPRQEIWVHENRDAISARVVLTAGACIEYIAGAAPTPPRWLGAIGMEWAYRLATSPRRLCRRYLIEPWYVFARLIRELSNRS